MGMESVTIDSSQLEGFLRQNKAQYVQVNEAGGHVYRASDDSTIVIYMLPGGKARVTRIAKACAC